jgi:hypothetical protein
MVKERLSFLDGVADLDVDGLDGAGGGGVDRGVHLHRLEGDDEFAFLDLGTDGDAMAWTMPASGLGMSPAAAGLGAGREPERRGGDAGRAGGAAERLRRARVGRRVSGPVSIFSTTTS